MADGSQITHPRPCDGGRFSAPDAVWERVRADYLDGMSAPDACRRHGVRVSALRARAAREGWRRMDQPWGAPPNRLDAWDEGVTLEDRVGGDLDKIDMAELSWVASRRMMRAALRGDAAEALRWRRVRLVMDQEEYELGRMEAQHESIRRERAGWAEWADERAAAPDASDAMDAMDATDASDASDGVSGDGGEPAVPAP